MSVPECALSGGDTTAVAHPIMAKSKLGNAAVGLWFTTGAPASVHHQNSSSSSPCCPLRCHSAAVSVTATANHRNNHCQQPSKQQQQLNQSLEPWSHLHQRTKVTRQPQQQQQVIPAMARSSVSSVSSYSSHHYSSPPFASITSVFTGHHHHQHLHRLMNSMTLFLLLLLSLTACSIASAAATTTTTTAFTPLPTSGLDIVSRCQQNCPQQLVSTACFPSFILIASLK